MLHVIHIDLEKNLFFPQLNNACEEAFPHPPHVLA